MPLWLSVVLLIFLATGMINLVLHAQRKGKKAWMITSIIMLSVIVLVGLTYIMLTFLLVDAVKDMASTEHAITPAASVTATPTPEVTPMLEVNPTPEIIPIAVVTAIPKPDDYDLPREEVIGQYPDVLALKNVQYEAMPVLGLQNEVTKYILHQLLNNQFEMEFYLEKDFAIDEGTGYTILDRACETAMSYYLFSAYNVYDMFTEEREGDNQVYAKIKLIYTQPDFDIEAQAEALEFVMKNPVPEGGFKDFESEKAYALKIHDFIAKKITYSPIGYDPEAMFGLGKYEACQEVYNVLDENQTEAVCAGYARAFALIAQYAGINTAWVRGNETETESHAWNVIYPCDGSEAVLVDVTWDDTESDDRLGQDKVCDTYFYIPLSEEYEHWAEADFDEFLQFINRR
jgi:hypothetical protein